MMLVVFRALLPRLGRDAKLDEDFRSASPVSQCHGGRHRLVPFVLEEGGRFGDHALALLSEIAEPWGSGRQAQGAIRILGLLESKCCLCVLGAQVEAGGLWLAPGHHVWTLFFARHLVPPCMGPKLRTRLASYGRSLDWLHLALLDCPTFCNEPY